MFLKRVSELIKMNNITKNHLLKEIGLSSSSFLDWERRGTTPSGEIIAKIAKYFNVQTDYLLGLTDNPHPLIIPEDLKNITIAFYRGEFKDLTQDEIQTLAVLAHQLKKQRINNANNPPT